MKEFFLVIHACKLKNLLNTKEIFARAFEITKIKKSNLQFEFEAN
jgi:hypothetical protein